MKISAINSVKQNVNFGEKGWSGGCSYPANYASLVKSGEAVPVENLPIHNYNAIKLVKQAQQAMAEAAKFTHEEVLAIAKIESLPKRLEKIADILQLKKIVKM